MIDETQPNNILPGKSYIFVINDEGIEKELNGVLLGTSQPAPFCPVFFDVILENDPDNISSFLVSSVKMIKQKYNKKGFKHTFPYLVLQWKEYFESTDNVESYEYTLHEFRITEDSIIEIKDIELQKKIIRDFKRSKKEIEKAKEIANDL